MSWIAVLLLLVVLVVVVLAVLVVAMRTTRRRKEQHRAEATALRTEAAVGSSHAGEARRVADEARLEADRLRAEADRAEHRAHEAEEHAVLEEARVEDRVRAADRIDPDVDHRSDDYTPEPRRPGPPRASRTATPRPDICPASTARDPRTLTG